MDFLKRYWLAILVAVTLNAGAWMCFEWFHSQEISIVELWTLRMSLVSGLLLLDNLGVLWWYAHLTRTLSETSECQFALASAQADESQRPAVFVDRKRGDPPQPVPGFKVQEPTTYVVRNAGHGLAVNIFLARGRSEPGQEVAAELTTLGALASGAETRLPEDEERPFRDGAVNGAVAVAVLAQSASGRWICTLNVRGRDGGVTHAVYDAAARTPQAIIQLEWQEIEARLRKMVLEARAL